MLAPVRCLQLAPQLNGAPTLFGDAPDELVDESEFSLDQRKGEFGFYDE
jgi:hypothetical protein